MQNLHFGNISIRPINHHDYSYEYAQDLGDNSIVYIYTAYKRTLRSLKKIPQEYLPDDFEESLNDENGSYWADDNYDIYQRTKSGERKFDKSK